MTDGGGGGGGGFCIGSEISINGRKLIQREVREVVSHPHDGCSFHRYLIIALPLDL